MLYRTYWHNDPWTLGMHEYAGDAIMPWVGVGMGLIGISLFTLFLVALVTLKGYVLWTAAKRHEMWWFVALMLINTLGILEIIYLYFFTEEWRKKKETKQHEHHETHTT